MKLTDTVHAEDKVVYISKRGRVYHTREDCPWWQNARDFSVQRGWHVFPAEKVKLSEVENKRNPCRVCVPLEESNG